jgi:hypothetical protein
MDTFGTLNLIALGIQIELIATAIIGWCPFYWSINIFKKK